MKTVQEYLTDPRILNDPAMSRALEPVRELHAIRLMIQDETAGMTLEEKASYHRRNATALFAGQGLPLPQYVNLSGQGKLKPRAVSAAGI
ncbi:hypothetical protein AGMMS49944_25680 [Spirochaetia bacterium]|nr:hypothetical protein AGMMS49944_25680 [Spirochaetia bacterium]